MPRITITVPEKSLQPYRFPIDRKSIVIGRKNNADVDIVVDSDNISTKHAEIRRLHGGYEMRDLDSTNGIAENGVRHPIIKLKNGSRIQLGFVIMDFQLNAEEIKLLEEEKAKGDLDIEPPPLPALPKKPLQVQLVEVPPDNTRKVIIKSVSSLVATIALCGFMIQFKKNTGQSVFQAIRTKIYKMTSPANQQTGQPAGTDENRPKE